MITLTADLNSTLEAVADYLTLSHTELCAYAAEDTHTGWDFGKGAWMCGSLHRPEGQTLYALIRALKPKRILEMGALEGCSSTHMAQALAANGVGKLLSVDIAPGTGSKLPEALRPYVTQRVEWAGEALDSAKSKFNLIYEDTDHSRATTRAIWEKALEKIAPGGVIISHDPFSASVGKAVIAGVTDALGHDNFLMVQVPPSDCGLLIYKA